MGVQDGIVPVVLLWSCCVLVAAHRRDESETRSASVHLVSRRRAFHHPGPPVLRWAPSYQHKAKTAVPSLRSSLHFPRRTRAPILSPSLPPRLVVSVCRSLPAAVRLFPSRCIIQLAIAVAVAARSSAHHAPFESSRYPPTPATACHPSTPFRTPSRTQIPSQQTACNPSLHPSAHQSRPTRAIPVRWPPLHPRP